MSIDNGDKIDQLLAEYRRLRPDGPTAEEKRDHYIDWVLGNLNASSRHRTTYEVVAAQYDKLYGKP